MKNERLYLDVHVLQTVPPSCINRDDTGSPKTAVYGGTTRARVSSQSWKRAMRGMFVDQLPFDRQSIRTKHLVKMIADLARENNAPEDIEQRVSRLLNTAGLKTDTPKSNIDNEKLKVLFYLSRAQAQTLADYAASQETYEKKDLTKLLKVQTGVEVALFGRMVADNKDLNVDACAQVAHSLSTHKVSNEFDYFTAVDDLNPEDTAGAGHIGTVEFNSSTLYRYATIALHELKALVPQGTAQAVRVFVDAFVRSMPTGKQNTFANRTLPEAVLVCLRSDQPVNLVGAFESPVKSNGDGFGAPSAARLTEHARQVYADFVDEPELCLASGRGLDSLCAPRPFRELLSNLESEIEQRLGLGGEQA